MGFQPSLRDLHLLRFRDPALKRRAIFGRPSGTYADCGLPTRLWSAGLFSAVPAGRALC